MKIAIPVSGYHPGTTAEYIGKAFSELGHDVSIINKNDFEFLLRTSKYKDFNLFFCVDSGEPLDFSIIPNDSSILFCMWFIDYRHNKNRKERIPNDFQNAKFLLEKGGKIFQAQYEDVEELKSNLSEFNNSIYWLPVAADPAVWSDIPKEEKIFDIGFAGNLWDPERALVLQALQNLNLKLGFKGHGALWKESAALLLRSSKVGFNISSFYGTAVAFDLNMRFFETLSCGVPLITNKVDAIDRIGATNLDCIKTYASKQELISNIISWILDEKFLNSGKLGREWILSKHTYVHRAKKIIEILVS